MRMSGLIVVLMLGCGGEAAPPAKIAVPAGARWGGDLQGLPWGLSTADGIQVTGLGKVPPSCYSTPDPVQASGVFDPYGGLFMTASLRSCVGLGGARDLSVTGNLSADLSTLTLRAVEANTMPLLRYDFVLRRAP